jgi:hypothetical protein
MALNTLPEIAEALVALGYEAQATDDAVHMAVGGSDSPFPTVLTLDGHGSLITTCRLARLGDVSDLEKFLFLALDLNTRILPYAVGVLTEADGQEGSEDDWPLVLCNSVPLGDFSAAELGASMDSLFRALVTCGNEFKALLS